MKPQIKTSDLISNFMFENGNRLMAATSVIDNGDTITIIIESIASKEFKKPDDFEEYLKSLE